MSVVTQVSKSLFEVFRQIVPPPVEWKNKYNKNKARPLDLTLALEQFYAQAKDLRKKNRLGVVSRARVVISLQREMNKAGYPSDMSRQVLFSMVVSAFVGKV